MKEIIDIIHKSILPFFDVCENEEEPLSDKDKLLLKVNKAICNNLKALEQEPCEDVISREPFTDSTICEGFSCDECSFNRKDKGGCILEERVMNLPSAKQELKTGHWIYLKNERKSVVQAYKCSVCGWEIDSCRGLMQDTGHRLFCEHCGAKMIDSQERSDKE